ncbi:MAG: bifunctional UDP-N-acetylglucosamine diphosphorylase/glucosamine-1-phosphate N-acetyltransferase GlmU [Chloroflexota bacterium]|nr:bifunctional UDP-N-acetylglucosamine diphosphorylase/glucosamine-1-phosphate N-acetyltransferase GlmU [Chloroflexota bacterium]
MAVLAAGLGTRMNTPLPKHLQPVAGVPVVERVLRAGLAIEPDHTIAVVSPALADLPDRVGMDGQVTAVVQSPPTGTAAAVRHALDAAPGCQLLVSLLGDSPLLTGHEVARLVDTARASRAKVTILSCVVEDAAGYGRVERDSRDRILRIVERKNDALIQRQGRTEINSGIMVLEASWAREALSRLRLDPTTNEYLLTDLVTLAVADAAADDECWPVDAVIADESVAHGVNDLVELAQADAIARRRIRERHQRSGVAIIGPETVFIDEDVQIAAGAVILPYSMLTGRTRVGAGSTVGPQAILDNAEIGQGVTITASTIRASSVADGSDVGPYSHLRGGTVVGPNVHIGNYVEMKNAVVDEGVKCGHVSYLGDATVGAETNIGAGTITANFDGHSKHRTTFGAGVFTGSGTVLIAPVELGERARTGAGAVVNRDVSPGKTVVGVPARPIASRHRPSDEEPEG